MTDTKKTFVITTNLTLEGRVILAGFHNAKSVLQLCADLLESSGDDESPEYALAIVEISRIDQLIGILFPDNVRDADTQPPTTPEKN